MNWLRRLIELLFCKNKVKMIEAPKVFNNGEENNFITDLRRQADVEMDDRNGYKIIQNMRLEDMV